jgi:chromosome segregation ATPase
MSVRRAAPARAAGLGLVAQPAEPSLFQRTLVREAINAHLKNVTQRLKREPISQVNPFLVGRQNMIIKELKGGGGGGGAPLPAAEDAMEKMEELLAQLESGGGGGDADERIDQLQDEVATLKKSLKKGEEQRRRLQINLARLNEGDSSDSEADVDVADEPNVRNRVVRGDRVPNGLLSRTLANAAGAATAQGVDIAQLNPWLADFRDRLFKAQQEALKDDGDLRNEIKDYQLVIQDLREQLTKSKDEGDAARTAQIEALKKALEEEKKQVQALMEELEDKSSLADQYENQWRAVGGQLQESQRDLQSSEDKVKELEAEIVRRTVEAAVARSEIDSMEEKLKEATRMESLTAAEREALKVQVEVAVRELSEMEETLEEYKAAAEKAQSQFDDELTRNKTLLEELQTRRETLEKETNNLKRLVDKDALVEKRRSVVSGEI